MKRIMDAITIKARLFDGEHEVAGIELDDRCMTIVEKDEHGGAKICVIPRGLAMQAVRIVAEQIESAASDVMSEGGGDFESISTYAGVMTLDAPINVAFACPSEPDEWPDDDEEIVGADIGGGWSSIIERCLVEGDSDD